MGKALIIPGLSSTDADAPLIADVDQLLVDGSLFLMDPTHPVESWAAGMPADGATVPNLAWQYAAITLGSGDATTLAGIYDKHITAQDRIQAERSTKGGLHIAPQQSLEVLQHTVIGVRVPAAVKTYMKANKTHTFYHSVWRKVTRINDGSNGAHPIAIISTNATFGTSLADSTVNGNIGTYNNPAVGVRTPNNTLNAVQLNSMAAVPSSTFDTGSDTNPVVSSAAAVISGHRGSSNSNTGYGAQVFYRAYLEDLTVSGRTYAEVDQLDYNLMVAECLSPGGRYYGDTHTAPATLAGA